MGICKVAQGPVHARSCLARDVMLGLLKTCCKLGLSYAYLGNRLGPYTDQPRIPPLDGLVVRAA
jgi:hypothetical protein